MSNQPEGLKLSNPVHFLAFGFGSGCLPIAPGTWGTAAAIPIFLLMQPLSMTAYLGWVLIMAGIGIWLCDKTSRDLGVHDHGGIVWDEIVGYLITMIAAPTGLVWIVLGFFLFRIFDVIKPWPIGWADRKVHGGLGIMLDDVLAGIMACVTLQLIAVIF